MSKDDLYLDVDTRPKLVPLDQISTILPEDARERLIEAAKTENPVRRVIEMDKASAWVRLKYPKFFKSNKE